LNLFVVVAEAGVSQLVVAVVVDEVLAEVAAVAGFLIAVVSQPFVVVVVVAGHFFFLHPFWTLLSLVSLHFSARFQWLQKEGLAGSHASLE